METIKITEKGLEAFKQAPEDPLFVALTTNPIIKSFKDKPSITFYRPYKLVDLEKLQTLVSLSGAAKEYYKDGLVTQIIDVTVMGKSMYHTVKDVHNGVQFTGWHNGDIREGDEIMLVGPPNPFGYTVVEVVERRDHQGDFENPEEKKGSYYKVICRL